MSVKSIIGLAIEIFKELNLFKSLCQWVHGSRRQYVYKGGSCSQQAMKGEFYLILLSPILDQRRRKRTERLKFQKNIDIRHFYPHEAGSKFQLSTTVSTDEEMILLQ